MSQTHCRRMVGSMEPMAGAESFHNTYRQRVFKMNHPHSLSGIWAGIQRVNLINLLQDITRKGPLFSSY